MKFSLIIRIILTHIIGNKNKIDDFEIEKKNLWSTKFFIDNQYVYENYYSLKISKHYNCIKHF